MVGHGVLPIGMTRSNGLCEWKYGGCVVTTMQSLPTEAWLNHTQVPTTTSKKNKNKNKEHENKRRQTKSREPVLQIAPTKFLNHSTFFVDWRPMQQHSSWLLFD